MTSTTTERAVSDYPIPFDRDKIITLQEDADHIPDDEIIECVDTFHDRYIDHLVRNDEWMIFRCTWYGQEHWIYFWNRELSWGFRIGDSEAEMMNLFEAMETLVDEKEVDDFGPNRWPWEVP